MLINSSHFTESPAPVKSVKIIEVPAEEVTEKTEVSDVPAEEVTEKTTVIVEPTDSLPAGAGAGETEKVIKVVTEHHHHYHHYCCFAKCLEKCAVRHAVDKAL